MGMIDTLALSQKLEEAGMERKASEALTTALADGVDRGAVTKDVLDVALSPIHSDLLLLKWMTGLMLGGVLSLIAKIFF